MRRAPLPSGTTGTSRRGGRVPRRCSPALPWPDAPRPVRSSNRRPCPQHPSMGRRGSRAGAAAAGGQRGHPNARAPYQVTHFAFRVEPRMSELQERVEAEEDAPVLRGCAARAAAASASVPERVWAPKAAKDRHSTRHGSDDVRRRRVAPNARWRCAGCASPCTRPRSRRPRRLVG